MAKAKNKQSNLFQELMASTGNKFVDVVADGISTADVKGYIDTGSYILNAQLSGSIYGGLADNKTLALAGESSTGKTFAALTIVDEFLKSHPDGYVFYLDSETAVTSDMVTNRGIDATRMAIVPVLTIEGVRFQLNAILDKYLETPEKQRVPILIVLDSLGQLCTKKELEDIAKDSDKKDMTKAQLNKSLFRSISHKRGVGRVPMIVTAHTYDQIGAMFPQKILAGGSGLKYTGDMIIFLSKAKVKEGTEVVGNKIGCTLVKGRLTKENTRVKVGLSYANGLHRYEGLLELGEKYGVFKKVSNKYEINGKKAFEKTIYKNPEKYFTPEILDALDEAAASEFLYGNALEADEEEIAEVLENE